MPYYIGLISGTSMDAIDAALVRLEGTQIELVGYAESSYSVRVATLLERAVVGRSALTADEFGYLHSSIGHDFAAAANTLLARHGLTAKNIVAITEAA